MSLTHRLRELWWVYTPVTSGTQDAENTACRYLECQNTLLNRSSRWPGAGETTVGEYTILWSGAPEEAPRHAGVGLAMNRLASKSLICWYPLTDRILVAKFRHSFRHMSVVVAYAPTNEASDTDKDGFYWELEHAMTLVKRNDLTLVVGDFNAVSGFVRNVIEAVVGP